MAIQKKKAGPAADAPKHGDPAIDTALSRALAAAQVGTWSYDQNSRREYWDATTKRLRDRHAELFRELSKDVPPLPGAVELLRELTRQQLPWAIATSGRMRTAATNLKSLGVDPDNATVITRDMVRYAKPDPDLFVEAARRLGTRTQGSYVIGDSIWDMYAASRCGALGIALLSGGYGKDELERAGAMRVFDDPADMLEHLDELAPRTRD